LLEERERCNPREWVSKTGGHDSSIAFYSQVAEKTGFVERLLVVPLLSMRATGFISVERAAKPLKNYVWSKSCNRNEMEKSETLLHVGLNIRLLHQANKVMKKTMKPTHQSK